MLRFSLQTTTFHRYENFKIIPDFEKVSYGLATIYSIILNLIFLVFMAGLFCVYYKGGVFSQTTGQMSIKTIFALLYGITAMFLVSSYITFNIFLKRHTKISYYSDRNNNGSNANSGQQLEK